MSRSASITRRASSKLDKNLSIALLSQNTITSHIFTQSKANLPDIKKYRPDIYVEMTQEDSRFTLDSLTDIPHKYNHKHISLNTMGGIDKNVIMQLYYKKRLEKHIKRSFVSGTIELARKEGKSTSILYATKGAVYMYVKIPSYQPLLFVNMHLPVDTKDTETFGYEHRKKSLRKVITELQEKFQNEDPIIIAGGDLNFRINPTERTDQLTEFLKTDKNPGLRELEFPDPDGKIFTCKFTNDNTKCRENVEPSEIDEGTATEETIVEIQEDVQKECGDKDRFPSRCDRFLTNRAENIDVKIYRGHYIQELPSDHNAIYAVLEIEQNNSSSKLNMGGKQITTRKKRTKGTKKRQYYTYQK